jgi:nuclear transport factor 2 (NTF2) superfamily protein
MTNPDVAEWLDRYVEAWTSYDPDAIRSLFAEDAEYRYRPSDEPLRGREAIVADWLRDRDAPGTYEASYAPWAVEGKRAVATGRSTYSAPDNAAVYDNVFLLEFDEAGECTSFTEVFVKQR